MRGIGAGRLEGRIRQLKNEGRGWDGGSKGEGWRG